MIVSHRHKFIFFAVPRTGTHAIRTALEPFLGPEDWQQEGLVRRVHSPLPALAARRHGHITVCQARRHLPDAILRSYFTFAFVRNPYDRYVSLCAALHGRNAGYAGNETAWMKRTLANMQGQMDAATFRRMVLVGPQAGMLTDSGRPGVDFIGRYEALQSAFAEICRRIGIPEQALSVVNAAAHAPSDTYYDDELRGLVARFYRRDFELFGYASDLPLQSGCPEGRHEEQPSDRRGRAGCKQMRGGVPNAP